MTKRVQSPSSINTFKQCKRKYYYNYIEKLPTVPNIHQVRGNIAHSVLEDFYDLDINNFTDQDFETKIRQAMQQLFLFQWNKYLPRLKNLRLSPDKEQFYFEETMMMLLNWTNQFLEEIKRRMQLENIAFQQAFSEITPIREQEFRSEELSVRGFIDAIRHVNEEIHIIDYKTNSNFEFKESIKLQLAIYSLLYYELHNKMPDKVGIFFLRHKLKMINVDSELLELARKEIEIIHGHTTQFQKIEYYPKTINGLCKWKTGECDFYNTCKPHDNDY